MKVTHNIFLFFPLLISTICCSQTKFDENLIELNNRALELFREDKTDSALTILDQVIEIDSSYTIAYYNKCNFLWELERNNEALITAKKLSIISKEDGFMILGLAFEKVGELDSAKAYYKYLLEKARGYDRDTLDFRTKLGFATLLTIVEGSEFGYLEIQNIFKQFENDLNQFELQELKTYRNEIASYQNGGFLEFMEGNEKQYCYSTEIDIEELREYLLNKGINAQIVGKDDGYYLQVKDKFRNKISALGITECK